VGDTVDFVFGAPPLAPRPDIADASVPPELAAIIEHALEPDPRNRFGSAAELQSALAAIDVTEEGPARRLRPSRRTGVAIIVGAAVVAALAIAGIVRGRLTAPGRIRSLAVLPLVNASKD